MGAKQAIVLGATGLIGSELLKLLIQDDMYEKIVVFVRKPLTQDDERVEQVVIDFRQLKNYASYFDDADVFCCLGTTIKKAKTKQAFKEVDYSYPLQAAKLTVERKTGAFLVVTAMGANAKSAIFYNRVKGELEDDLKQLGLRGLHIFRPSLLLGHRAEHRAGEKAMAFVMSLLSIIFVGPLRKYNAIHGSTVAKAMLVAAKWRERGIHVYLSDQIEAMGG